MTPNSLARLLVVFWLGTACGCSVLDLRGKLAQLGADEKPQVPTRIVEVWTNEILTQSGLPGVRGFAGRVMFYNGEQGAPVKVDGTFTVLAFDEADAENGYTAPERKFVYLPEQLPKYYSKSELGHSYSFWLPWDEVGGPDRKVCLIARFEPRKGGIVASTPCHKLLSGVTPQPGQLGSSSMRMAKRTAGGEVRQVSHEAPLGESRPGEPQESITSFTINVPRSFARPDPPAGKTPPDGGSASAKTGESAGGAATSSAATQPGERAARSSAATGRPGEARSGEPRPGASEEASPSSHYARRRFPARRESIAPPRFDPVRRQPLPATPLSSLPPTPRSGWQDPGPGSSEADESRSR